MLDSNISTWSVLLLDNCVTSRSQFAPVFTFLLLGTNPASAAMAGFDLVAIECTSKGSIDIENLKKHLKEHQNWYDRACCELTWCRHLIPTRTFKLTFFFELCSLVRVGFGSLFCLVLLLKKWQEIMIWRICVKKFMSIGNEFSFETPPHTYQVFLA